MKKKIFLKRSFALIVALCVLAFAACNNGGDDDDDETSSQATATTQETATSGSVSPATTDSATGIVSAKLTDSAGGVYTFTQTSSASGGTWTYTVSDVVKYSGSYTGDISALGSSALTLTLTVEKAISRDGKLATVSSEKTFALEASADDSVTATIPAVSVAMTENSYSATEATITVTEITADDLKGKTLSLEDESISEQYDVIYYVFGTDGSITETRVRYQQKGDTTPTSIQERDYTSRFFEKYNIVLANGSYYDSEKISRTSGTSLVGKYTGDGKSITISSDYILTAVFTGSDWSTTGSGKVTNNDGIISCSFSGKSTYTDGETNQTVTEDLEDEIQFFYDGSALWDGMDEFEVYTGTVPTAE